MSQLVDAVRLREEHPPRARPGSAGWLLATAALGAVLLWTRLTGLGRSLWWDEAFTAHRYVRGGLETIFDPSLYSANNHVLYSILAHTTAVRLGSQEVVLRSWALLPALVAVGLLVWLLWRRLGPPAAVLALALVTASPLAVALHTEARGYGLVLLSATVLLVVPVVQHRQPTWGGDVSVAVAGTVAMLTFAPAVTVYLAHTGLWLLLRGVHRVRLVALTAAAGAATALTLRGLLPVMLEGADRVGSRHAEPLGWWSPATAALQQQVGSGLQAAVPGPAGLATAIALAAGWVGVAVLVVGRDRPLGLHVATAVVVPVAVLAVMGFHPIDRYLAFVMPQAVTAVATGLAAACGALARHAASRAQAWAVGVVVAVLLLGGVPAVQAYTAVPLQDFASVAAAVELERPEIVVTGRLHVGYAWYLEREVVTVASAEGLERHWCQAPRPAVYVPNPDRTLPGEPACLDEAAWVGFEMQREPGEMGYYVLRD